MSVEVALSPTPIQHTARVYQSYPGSNYVLPADEQEAKRLHLQHAVLKQAFEGRTLLAPHNEGHAYFVLDSGAGAASWLLDAANQLSTSAILHGIDIEKRLFPSEHPANVSFSVNTVTGLPAEWTERFDFVHQRLLVAALRNAEWVLAIFHMHRVLRTGGWVQLGEIGDLRAGPVTERFMGLVNALFSSRQLVHEVSKELPRLLEERGFSNISIETRSLALGSWAGTQGCQARDNFLGVYRGMKTPVLRAGGLGFVTSEEEYDTLLDDLEKEWDSTEGAGIDFHIIVAQK